MLIAIAVIPILVIHLLRAKRKVHRKTVWVLNGYKNKLRTAKLILYASGLVVFAFLIWGIKEPLDKIIANKVFNWLPEWYTVQKSNGYSEKVI